MQLPEFDARLNFIASYFYAGCRTPFLLMVQCAREPAGEAAMAFLDVGLDGIVRSFFRPKGLRSGRHGKKRRKGKNLRGIPEISDMMADRVEGLDDFRHRPIKDGTRLLWELDTIGQRIIGEIAIIDIASDFVFKSMIGMLKLKATHCDIAGRCFIKGGDNSPFNNGQTYAIYVGNVEYVEMPVYVDAYNAHVPAGNWAIIATATCRASSGGGGGNIDLIFGINGGDTAGAYVKEIRGLAPGSSESSIFGAAITGPADLHWLYKATGGIAEISDVKIQIMPSLF